MKRVFLGGSFHALSLVLLSTLAADTTGPVITQQPANLTLVAGQTATFTVEATGTPPLAYQWFFNGAGIAGAIGSTFARSGIQAGDAGWYRVTVANASGVATSAVATLTVRIPSLPSGDQSDPAVACDGQNYLVVWTDASHRATSDDDILGALVGPDGRMLTPGGFPICARTNAQTSPQVGFDGANYLVVWMDDRDLMEDHPTDHIYGARVSREGRVLDPEGFRISNGRVGQHEPQLAFNGTNSFVVWTDWRHYETSICDIYGARVTPEGVVLDPEGVSVCQAPLWQTWPHVAALAGGFYVVWDAMGLIRGSRVSGEGRVLEPAGVELGAAVDEGQPAVGVHQGHYLVTWHSNRFVQVPGGGGYYSNSVVLARRVSPLGAVVDLAPRPLWRVNMAFYHTDVAGAGDDGWVVWQEGENYGGVSNVRGVRLRGGEVSSEALPIGVAAGEQMWPCVAAHRTGGALVVWQDGRHAPGAGGGPHVIYGARLSSAGAVLDPEGLLIGGGFRETPILRWPEPGDITYGTPLSESQLNAAVNVPGTFVYAPPRGTFLNAGFGQILRVTFAPADPARYTGAQAETRLDVLPAPLTIRADDQTRLAGTPNPPLTATYTGLVHGDTPAVLDTPPTLTTTATPASPPGAYPILISAAADPNYTIEQVNGVLTVLPAPSGPGCLDPTFPVVLGWSGPDVDKGPTVHDLVKQADGKILVAGFFDRVSGVSRHHLARLLANGELDRGFQAGMIGQLHEITCLALQPDGKVLMAGSFTLRGGGEPRLARLNADGSLDATYRPPIVPEATFIADILAQPDGKALLSGRIVLDGLAAPRGVARLNTDGSVDRSFLPIAALPDGFYGTLALQPDGNILTVLGTGFTGSVRSDLVLRFGPDGSPDLRFAAPLSGFWVGCLRILPEGDLLVGGSFSAELDASGAMLSRNLVRLHSDGRVDPTFVSGVPGPFGVTALVVQPDGRLLAGRAHSGVVRLHPDGRLDEGFPEGVITPEYGGDSGIHALVLQEDGRILVGGAFASYNGVPALGLARLLNDSAAPQPFVRRHIVSPVYVPDGSSYEVQLESRPPPGVSAYAVEDTPPAGWAVSEANLGGGFDPRTGRVKFGPFFDGEARTLSYRVTPTPGGAEARFFTGYGSADGVDTPIAGPDAMTPVVPHPADRLAPLWRLTMSEVTAYGAAWRRGTAWSEPPNPIPIDYATRAAALWRGGEAYHLDASLTNAPLWWVNDSGDGAGGVIRSLGATGSGPAMSWATRWLPPVYVRGEPLTVDLAVAPAADVKAYAVEEWLPEGWALVSVSAGGEFDAPQHRVKWGPFIDDTARVLSYVAAPSSDLLPAVELDGRASFDGVSVVTSGSQTIAPALVLRVLGWTADGLRLSVTGNAGARLRIETSEDLVRWTPLADLSLTAGEAEWTAPVSPGVAGRFYRARLTE